MGYDKDTRRFNNISGRDMNMNDEQRAREQAYQEYLKLREGRSSRGNYVKNDEQFGSYFTNSKKGTNIEDTPYGNSEMRKKSKNEQIARQGRVNKADLDVLDNGNSKSRRMRFDKKKKKSGKGLKISFAVVLILVIGVTALLAAGITLVSSALNNMGKIRLNENNIGINPVVDEQLSGYRNIALLGIDSRDMDSDEGVRSDAIIIASINEETGEIKLFSVYRDTMLDLGDDVGLDKITHAYYYGGAEKVLYTLNKNLDLNIKVVMVVNWKAVADVVDALGGIEIDIQESEINEMNKYIHDTQRNIGGSEEEITEAGKQTLNGVQAVTYARIRKDALTGDYRRNERMKIVVKATFDKAKTTDIATIQKISKDVLPQIKTSMKSKDMMGLILDIGTFKMTDSVGWPYTTRGWTGNAWYGPPVTLNSNVIQLHEEFFAQPDYTPTDDVQGISAEISAKTGYY